MHNRMEKDKEKELEETPETVHTEPKDRKKRKIAEQEQKIEQLTATGQTAPLEVQTEVQP